MPSSDQPLELDGADFGAVLLVLAAPLRLLVAVELALGAVGGAVEEIDGAPEELFEVGLEARAIKRRGERIEDVDQRDLHGLLVRQGARVGFVLARPVAVERKLGDDRRRGRRFVLRFGCRIV